MVEKYLFHCRSCDLEDETGSSLEPTEIVLRCPECSRTMELVTPLDRVLGVAPE